MGSVQFEGVSHRRPGAFDCLVELTLEVADGDLVALVGPSGSGASTALRLLAGFEEPTCGTIRIAGRDVAGLAPRDRNVALVLPHHALYPHLTVADHLAFPLAVAGTSPAAVTARVGAVASRLRLESLLGELPGALAPVDRQRVALGRALVRRPAVLLMDDPLSGLDATDRHAVRDDLLRLHDQLAITTIAVVPEDDDPIGARTVHLEGGRRTAPVPA